MIKCPACGTMNEDGSMFCESCIQDLLGLEPEAGSASAPPPAEPAPDAAPMAEAAPIAEPAMAEPAMAEPVMMAEEAPIAMAAEEAPAELMAEPAPEMAAPLEEAPLDLAAETPPVEGAGVELVEAAPADAGFADEEVALGLEAGAGAVDAGGAPVDPTAPTANLGPPGAPAGEGLPPISAVFPGTDSRVSAVQSAAAAELIPTGPPTETVLRLSPDAKAKLVVVRGLKANIEYPVYEGPNYIGRHDLEPVDIDLTDQESEDNCLSSRRHACITWENENLFIEDMKSSNGTFVMKVKLTEGEKRHLKNGEYVQVGSVLFRVKR